MSPRDTKIKGNLTLKICQDCTQLTILCEHFLRHPKGAVDSVWIHRYPHPSLSHPPCIQNKSWTFPSTIKPPSALTVPQGHQLPLVLGVFHTPGGLCVAFVKYLHCLYLNPAFLSQKMAPRHLCRGTGYQGSIRWTESVLEKPCPCGRAVPESHRPHSQWLWRWGVRMITFNQLSDNSL